MCSTPDGIEEGLTSWKFTNAWPDAGCSTPDGIEEGLTFLKLESPRVRAACSTPDGIEEGLTATTSWICCWTSRCSTPDGIEEGLTHLRRRKELRHAVAIQVALWQFVWLRIAQRGGHWRAIAEGFSRVVRYPVVRTPHPWE